MSASSMLALTCISVRSLAITNKRRRRHARGHRLPNIHVARDDDAVNRRRDDGVTQVHAVLVERRERLRHLRLRAP